MSLTNDIEIELMKILTNQRRLRAFFRSIPSHHVPSIANNVDCIAKEIEQEEERKQREQKARAEKIAEYRSLLAAEGIKIDDLISSNELDITSPTRTKRDPRPAKYEYVDVDGNKRQWTGQGRQPVPIRTAIENGMTLEDFLIK